MNPESAMEKALQDAGFQLSETPLTEVVNEQQAEAVQPVAAQPSVTEEAAPTAEPTPGNTEATPEPVVEAPTTPEVAEQPDERTQDPAPALEVATDEKLPTVESGSSMTNQVNPELANVLEQFERETQIIEPQTVNEEDTTESASDIDPRIQVIADFVAKTGRTPEDWFRYQALDPSEMDDRTAMRVHYASEYPTLGNDEIDLLINSKYHTDATEYGEEDAKVANLQLKIDAQKARQQIDKLRSEYQSPVVEQSAPAAEPAPSQFDADWVSASETSLSGLDKISFDLSGGKEFHYGIPETYRSELKSSNSNMEEFFDRYKDNNGRFDHDLWNMHRTVSDNLPSILRSVYSQGLSDGQRNIVEKAANIDAKNPTAPVDNQPNSVAEQVLDALGRRTPFMKNL